MRNDELSELNFGLVLSGRQPVTLYKPDWFSAPYDKGIEILMQKGATKEDVAKVVSSSYLNDAHDSIKRMNGLGEELDWVKALQESWEREVLGKKFQKIGKRLENNEDVDMLTLHSDISASLAKSSNETRLLKDIDYEHFTPMIESGFEVLDEIVGGVPQHGVISVLGETGLGKSFFLAKFADRFLNKYPDKMGMIISMEMPAEEYAQRSVEMYPTFKKLGSRLYINGGLRTIDDIILEATTHKIDFIGIDYLDLLVKEKSESGYAYVWERCMEMGRLLRIPVVVLAQSNREGVRWGKFLTKFDFRWSGMAENSSWMIIGLQKTNSLDTEEPDKYPTFDDDREYLLILKLRGKWKNQIGPGAIVLEPSNQKWSGKAHGNRLWTPQSGSKKIGKRKEKG